MQKVKALVLLSGGLDSMLAARVLMEQGIEVTGITFVSNFFDADKGKKAAKDLGIKHVTVDFKTEHLSMVKAPKYGYGKNMNPCIDCHALMLRNAKEIMDRDGFDFVATGEVLGQRPMSQNKSALAIVAKISGLGDKLVRPLSGKLLGLTDPEKKGKIKREDLLNISGRSRSRQTEMAEVFGLKEYPSPAGGCLLTVPEFSNRLKKLFENIPEAGNKEVELLKCGRVFYFNHHKEKLMVIIGRDQEDNEKLEKFKGQYDVLVNFIDELGPTALIRTKNRRFIGKEKKIVINIPTELTVEESYFNKIRNDNEIFNSVGRLTGFYANKIRGKKIEINFKT